MKYPPKIVGLVQAAAVAFYVSAFAFTVKNVQEFVIAKFGPLNVVLGIILFLMSFVASALICGAIIFAYPVTAFFDGRRKEALKMVLWSAVWLVILIAIFATAGLLILLSK